MTISAVSLLLGIPVPTIRSWERRYAFPAPSRTKGSHRRYGIEEINQLRVLRDEVASGRRAQDAVALIRKRGTLARGGPARWITELLDAAMGFDVDGIRRVIEQATIALGVDRTIELLLLPVLREIGTRWEAGKCDVANEHLASQEIRRWLSARLATTDSLRKDRTAVLACGPADLHTIGLEGFYVMLSRQGWDCRFLGAQTPTESLALAIASTKPDAVIVASQMGTNRRATVQSIKAAALEAPGRVFYAGRAFVTARSRKGVPGTYLGESMEAALELLGTLPAT
jgi:MerR family transcriptional regulator, light-induced transcriptional regulator